MSSERAVVKSQEKKEINFVFRFLQDLLPRKEKLETVERKENE